MSSFRVVMISDTHLSRQRPFFHHNWEVILENINSDVPDLVLIFGDLSLNGFAIEDDLKFAKEQFDRIDSPVKVIPGNHDLGNNIPSHKGGPIISLSRRSAYLKYYKNDWWAKRIDNWMFIGLNSLLFNSGFDSDHEQMDWLLQILSREQGCSIALCLHKPLYHLKEDSTGFNQLSLFPQDRQRIFELIQQHHNIKLVISGHLHEHQIMAYAQAKLLWTPSTAFVIDQPITWWIKGSMGIRQVGYLKCNFEGDNYHCEYIRPLMTINHDIGNWLKGGMNLYLQNTTQPFKGFPEPGRR